MVLWLNSFGQYRFTLKCEWFVYRQVMIFLYLDPDNLNTKLTCKCNIFLNLQNTLSDIWCTNIRHEKCISKYDRLLLLMDRWIMSKFTAYIVCTNVLISSGLLSDFLTFNKSEQHFYFVEWNGKHEKTLQIPGYQYRARFSTRCVWYLFNWRG